MIRIAQKILKNTTKSSELVVKKQFLVQGNNSSQVAAVNNKITKQFSAASQELQEETVETGEGVQGEQKEEVEGGELQEQVAPVEQILQYAFTQEERLEVLENEKQILQKKMSIRLFDVLQNMSNIANNRDMKNIGQQDQQWFLKSRIQNLLKRQNELSGAEMSYQLYDWISESFSKGEYQIIHDKDFKHILFNPDYKQLIPLFYSKKFFADNNFIITNQDIGKIVQLCKQQQQNQNAQQKGGKGQNQQQQVNYSYLLELIKYHKQFQEKQQGQSKTFKMQFNEQQSLIEFLQNSQSKTQNPQGEGQFSFVADYDVLSTYYHFQALNSQNIMTNLSTEEILKQMTNIVFGKAWSRVDKQQFKQNLHDLLFINFQASTNSHFQLFVADLFFSQESYKKSLTAVSILSMILSRLSHKSNKISDLLHIFKSTLGESKFEFYLEKHLVDVLQRSYANKDKYHLYVQGLKLYQQQVLNGVKSFNFQQTTYFDEQFGIQNQDFENKIFYNFSNVQQTEIATYNMQFTQHNNTENNILKVIKQESSKHLDQQRGQKIGDFNKLKDYQAFIENDKVGILKYLQHQLKFHGKLSNLYSLQDLEKNKDNQQYLNDLLVKSFNMITEYNSYEKFNIKRYLERKQIPFHNAIKYKFSVSNNNNAKSLSEQYQQQDLKNFPVFSLYQLPQQNQHLKNQFLFSQKQKYGYSTTPKDNFTNDFNEDHIVDDLDIKGDQSTTRQGFKDFIEKSKEIDTNQDINGENLNGKNPFVSKEDLSKIKNLQQNISGSQNNKKKFQQSFSGLEVRQFQQQQQQQNRSQQQQQQNQAQQKVQVEHVKLLEKDYFNNLLEKQEEMNSMLLLQKTILELPEADRVSVLSGLVQLKEIISQETTKSFQGEAALYRIFQQPTIFKNTEILNPVTQENLQKAKYQVLDPIDQSEVLNIDFSKYLTETIMPYQLPEKAAISILYQLQNQAKFSKKQFKRILAHLTIYSREIQDSVIFQIVNICEEKRIPQTLTDFAKLVINNKIVISEVGFRAIISGVYQYKDQTQEVQELMKLAFQQYKWEPTYELLEPYVKTLISFDENDKIFEVFQFMKKLIFSQKQAYNDSLTSDQNIQIQEQQKLRNRKQALGVFRSSMRIMNQKNLQVVSQLIYNDMVALKYELEEEDFINAIEAYKEDQEQLQELYDTLKKQPKLQLSEQLLECLFNVVQSNIQLHSEFFEQIIKDLMVSERIAISQQSTNQVIFIYSKNRDYTSFGNFLKFLISSCNKTNNQTKFVAYKIVNESTEEMSKGYIKGLLADLFSPEHIEKIKEKARKEYQKNPQNQDGNNMNNRQRFNNQQQQQQQFQNRDGSQRYGQNRDQRPQQQQQQQQQQHQQQNQQQNQERRQQFQKSNNQNYQQNQQQYQQQKQAQTTSSSSSSTYVISEIKSKKEDVSEIEFLQKRIQKSSSDLENVLKSKAKRKNIKNAGAEKYGTTIEYLETGVET